jgi:signal transduction histidine kinase
VKTTVRVRLTLVYVSLFLVTAGVLTAGVYVLTARTTAASQEPASKVEDALGLPAGTLSGERPATGDRRALSALPPLRTTLRDVANGVQTQTRSQLLSRLTWFSAGLVGLMTLVSFAVGWVATRRMLQPIRRITERARSLAPSNLHQPMVLEGPYDEFRELGETFDQMLARLDAAFAGQRLFIANASHELRTPLTRIRTMLDVTFGKPNVTAEELDELASVIRDAVDRSSDLIDALLTLALAEGEIGRELVALDQIVRGSIQELSDDAEARDIRMEHSVLPASVRGDRVLLEHLVRNLVENAIKHNIEGGWVNVELGADVNGVLLDVSNGGAVLNESSIDALFLPLRRGDTDRLSSAVGGSGLGLAIVKAVTEAHQGDVVARPLPTGGLAVEVTLPHAEEPSRKRSTPSIEGS